MSEAETWAERDLRKIVNRVLDDWKYGDLEDHWSDDLQGRNIWTRGLVGAVQSGNYDLIDHAEKLIDPGGKKQYLSLEHKQMARGVVACARLVRKLTEDKNGDLTGKHMGLVREAGRCFTASPDETNHAGCDANPQCSEARGSVRERIDAGFRSLVRKSSDMGEAVALTMAWDLCRTMIGRPRDATDGKLRRR